MFIHLPMLSLAIFSCILSLCCLCHLCGLCYSGPGHHYLRIENAEGYVLIAVYLHACVRVIRISQNVLNRFWD